MNIAIILLAAVGVLFVTAYFSRRRFGVLGLALSAGYLLSIMWTDNVTTFLRDMVGIDTPMPALPSAVAALLVLSPAVWLLFRGPTYHKKLQRLISAVAFALLATAYMLTPLGNTINFDSTSHTVYTILSNNRDFIITAGIVYALYDLVTYRPKKEK